MGLQSRIEVANSSGWCLFALCEQYSPDKGTDLGLPVNVFYVFKYFESNSKNEFN